MRRSALRVALAAAVAASAGATVFLREDFSNEEWRRRWVQAEDRGFIDADHSDRGGGVRPSPGGSYHAISAKLPLTFSTRDRDVVMQLALRHVPQGFGDHCVSGYIKLLGEGRANTHYFAGTPYMVQFGAEVCGKQHAKAHLIFDKSGSKIRRKGDIEVPLDDQIDVPHLYTLALYTNDTYVVYFNMEEVSRGQLKDHWHFPRAQPELRLFDGIGAVALELWSPPSHQGITMSDVLVGDSLEEAVAVWQELQPHFELRRDHMRRHHEETLARLEALRPHYIEHDPERRKTKGHKSRHGTEGDEQGDLEL